MNDVTYKIIQYYAKRGLKVPDVWHALAFADTEKAEALEVLLAKEGGWIRNNPDSKPGWDKDHFAEELGDVIMMVIVAGLAEGVDPVEALLNKMNRKLQAHTNGN